MTRLLKLVLFIVALSGCENKQAVDVESLAVPSGIQFEEGVHFRRLDVPLNLGSDQITVSEFFWYGCSHCENFEPVINEWERKKPIDVTLERLPAVWNDAMALHGKLYFMAKNLGKMKELHPLLFKEVMALRSEANLESQLERFAQLFVNHGIEIEDFNAQLNAFKTVSQLENAVESMEKARINSTPSLMVNGKYVVISNSVKTTDELMSVVNYLVELERKG